MFFVGRDSYFLIVIFVFWFEKCLYFCRAFERDGQLLGADPPMASSVRREGIRSVSPIGGAPFPIIKNPKKYML